MALCTFLTMDNHMNMIFQSEVFIASGSNGPLHPDFPFGLSYYFFRRNSTNWGRVQTEPRFSLNYGGSQLQLTQIQLDSCHPLGGRGWAPTHTRLMPRPTRQRHGVVSGRWSEQTRGRAAASRSGRGGGAGWVGAGRSCRGRGQGGSAAAVCSRDSRWETRNVGRSLS